MGQEQRRHPRYTGDVAAWIAWSDQDGTKRHLIGRCVDISVSGARIQLMMEISPGTKITIGIPRLKLVATATVRHCSKTEKRYSMGVEFAERVDAKKAM